MLLRNTCFVFSFVFSLLSLKIHAQLPAYVPTLGLSGYWLFSGNANDESGNGNNGTVNGAQLTSNRFSAPNQAYSFNGSSDFISTLFPGIPALLHVRFLFGQKPHKAPLRCRQ
jgi:hypothetical protein